MLVVPMNDHTGRPRRRPPAHEPARARTAPYAAYPADLVPLLLSLATQAAVCVKANQLTASIRRLFEDFAQAAIVAVEQRDPTTAGHSNRVADLTVELARARRPRRRRALRAVSLLARGDARDLHGGAPPRLREDLDPRARPRQGEEARGRTGLGRIRDRFDFVARGRGRATDARAPPRAARARRAAA